MRTTILVTVVWLLMLSTSAVYAQRIEPVLDNGHPVINCDGMRYFASTTPKGSTAAALKTAAANEKVYKRFAVSNKDNSTLSLYSEAFTVCSSVSGGSWRLPTQRELMLMWVLKRELDKTSGFTPFGTTGYWSATEFNTLKGWNVSFFNGMTRGLEGTSTSSVRCVRELTP